ncbi:zinc ribbon domain-containing protein [Metabacillus iocasae]|uniref:NADH pyrophosphatase NudC (Nudix superfamily) n=1 Tax=Priestia iocasae TaxID=2291674 RepID=A0ABS2QWY1_9BACI|nr:zinc ribbon domain-containing protein [Metabacillus iocasae]MBM7703991.1 NADH pyrophosphatase NudC (nudix superfamily) [Metabacillus iocasae]
MNDLQTKLGGGLNKIQDSLQQGKQKIQVAQEVSQYKKIIQDAGMQRAEILLQIGENVYQKVRSGELQHAELLQDVQAISTLDRKIYQAQQSISQLTQASALGALCSCGAAITPADKFCGSCGSQVELQQTSIEETKSCSTCEEQIAVTANFCTCCGAIAH